jgi:hypothetical protein
MFGLHYDKTRGLVASGTLAHGVKLDRVPLRVRVQGGGAFYVWGMVDSGEGAPAWAEPDLDLVFFGPGRAARGTTCRVETLREGRRVTGWRATGTHARAEVVLEWRLEGDAARITLAVRNPQHLGGQRLPLCRAELALGGLDLGADAEFLSAHAYGGRTHGWGRVKDLVPPGMPFHHGCIGLALPLVYLHSPKTGRGLEFEFMLDGRPTAWLRPGARRGTADFALTWTTERLLLPGQVHAWGGALGLAGFAGDPVQRIRDWRDTAAARYGIRTPPKRDWVKQRSCIELWLNPGAYKEFTRFDDPALRAMLKRWRDWGYNAIMAVAPNPFGKHPLSPFHYEPNEACGGRAAEQVMLGWMHELGFHVGIWFTTVGLDRSVPQAESRRDWWTHRPGLEPFYAWDSNAANGFVGYAPDGDPGSTGWRRFMLEQLRALLARGWDGVFIDGCIPRASNHARWFWPGEARNAVEDQVAEIGAAIRASGKDAVLTDEDAGLGAQVAAEITTGRYGPVTPFFKKAYWDHGMGGGPKEIGEPPPRIPPELVRDYLRVRFASLLPDAISEDGVEGFACDEARPWTVQTMLAGPTTFKTHAEYVNDPLTFRRLPDSPEPGLAARDPERRRQGHAEFLRLLQFRATEPLVHADVPLSIEGVTVEGDAGVVGLLRPTARRCLLVLINFADRDAAVRVRLAAPVDVPAPQRRAAGAPQMRAWRMGELVHSIRESADAVPAAISARVAASAALGPYGFRVFELLPA